MVNTETKIIKNLATTLNLLGDTIRLEIVIYLLKQRSSVNQLAHYLNVSQPLVSHHLRILKDAKIIEANRDGRKMIYCLADEKIRQLLELTLTKEVI